MRTLAPSHPTLTSGQLFLQPGGDGQQADQVITIVRIERDSLGFRQVVFQAPNGRKFQIFADQMESAIATGHLRPIAAMVAAAA